MSGVIAHYRTTGQNLISHCHYRINHAAGVHAEVNDQFSQPWSFKAASCFLNSSGVCLLKLKIWI